MIDFRIDMTRAGLSADTEKLELLDLPAVPILTSQPLDLPLSACPEEIWLHFYQACEAVGISCGIPTGLVIRRAPFLRGDYDTVGCLFARTSPAQQANSAIPAGRYAVGYIRAPYGCTQPLYRALDAFIRAAGLQPTGDAYEECILDEVTSADPEHYLFRLSVQVG